LRDTSRCLAGIGYLPNKICTEELSNYLAFVENEENFSNESVVAPIKVEDLPNLEVTAQEGIPTEATES
jgi:hypothetical protein